MSRLLEAANRASGNARPNSPGGGRAGGRHRQPGMSSNHGGQPARQPSGFMNAHNNVNRMPRRQGETPQRPRGHQSRFNRRR